jgi:transcriptional regulator with XRE-family HTH domain
MSRKPKVFKNRRQAVPIEQYPGELSAEQRGLALYGPLARDLGRKIKLLRENEGWTPQQAARRLGINPKAYQRMEVGALILTPEVQRRVIELYFKRTTRGKHPTMPALAYEPKEARHVYIRWFDAELWWKANRFSITHGVSISATVAAALDRFLGDEPALCTIKAALDVAEKLRTESILTANPDLVYILRGDPQVAKLASLAEERPAEYHPALKHWNPLWDGPASPIAADELAEGLLAPSGDDE